jgi:hypothetical protein
MVAAPTQRRQFAETAYAERIDHGISATGERPITSAAGNQAEPGADGIGAGSAGGNVDEWRRRQAVLMGEDVSAEVGWGLQKSESTGDIVSRPWHSFITSGIRRL